MKLNFASKELWIIVQNLTLLVIATIVFLGTIWPFIIEAMFDEQVSVGEPFMRSLSHPLLLFLPLCCLSPAKFVGRVKILVISEQQ